MITRLEEGPRRKEKKKNRITPRTPKKKFVDAQINS